MKSLFALWAYYYLEIAIQIIQNVVRAKIVHQISTLSPGSRKQVDAAKVTNYLMVDISKITWFALFKPDLLYNPLLVVALLILCVFEISWVTVLMVVIVLVGQYTQTKVDLKFESTNESRMGIADKRGNRIGEIISGIKVIKLNAWEKVMDKMI